MRLLVCGSRDWTDADLMATVLALHRDGLELAEGAARGADRLAGRWARDHGVPLFEYPADWATHGKAAGSLRNKEMLNDFRPELVLAFKDGFDRVLRRGGTEHMVRISRTADVPVIWVSHGAERALFERLS